jgi:hypothetical protein
MTVAAQEFGRRMADNIGSPAKRLAEIGARQGVVDDQRDAGVMGDLRHSLEVDDNAARVGKVLDKDRFDPRIQCLAEILGLGRVDKMAFPAELFERQPKLGQ